MKIGGFGHHQLEQVAPPEEGKISMTYMDAKTESVLSPDWNFFFEMISPDRAIELLKGNTDNRALRRSVVAKYAATMSAQNWKLSPEAICIAKSGRILNGQHRLNAVVASGKTIPMLIVEGVDEDVFKVIDRGLGRTISDATGWPRKLAEVSRFAALLSQSTTNSSINDDLIEEFCEILDEPHSEVLSATNTTTRIFSSAPFRLAASVRIMIGDHPEYVKHTYKNLVLGNISELPPIAQNAIGSALSGRWDAKKSGAMRQRQDLARAWDLFDYAKSQNTKVTIKVAQTRADEIRAILVTAKKAANNGPY